MINIAWLFHHSVVGILSIKRFVRVLSFSKVVRVTYRNSAPLYPANNTSIIIFPRFTRSLLYCDVSQAESGAYSRYSSRFPRRRPYII